MPITVHKPAPMIAEKTIRRIKVGMHITVSTDLCNIRSSLPPKYPEATPINVETIVDKAAPVKPTMTEMRAP